MTQTTPLKVFETTKNRIRYGAAVLAITQQQFVDRAVKHYYESYGEVLEANRDAIANDVPLSAMKSVHTGETDHDQ